MITVAFLSSNCDPNVGGLLLERRQLNRRIEAVASRSV